MIPILQTHNLGLICAAIIGAAIAWCIAENWT